MRAADKCANLVMKVNMRPVQEAQHVRDVKQASTEPKNLRKNVKYACLEHTRMEEEESHARSVQSTPLTQKLDRV